MSATLTQIRQFVSSELSGEGVGGFWTATAGNTSNLASLVDLNWPVNTTLDVAEQWQDAWLLRPQAALATDKLRLVSQYTPNGGIITPDLFWTNSPAGEAYEIHTVIEPVVAMTRYINAALERIMIETEFSFTPIGGATWHSMALVAPWLINKSWVRQVGWLSSGEDRAQVWPYERVVRGEAVEENGSVVLTHPDHVFGGQSQPNPYTIYVRAMIPAYAACMTNQVAYGQISTITTDGTTWTVTPVGGSLGLQPGQSTTLAGSIPTAYNGTFIIVSTDGTSFTIANNLQPGPLSTAGTIVGNKQRNGLLLESDTVPARVEWAGWGTVVEAWRHYGQVLDTQARTRLAPNRQEAADMFTKWTRDQGKWPKLTFRPLLAGGPLNIGFGGTPFAYRATTA